MRFDVAVVGSANLDLVATTARHPAPGETVLGHSYAEYAGGKGLNQAIAASRAGATVAFVGAVGTDAAGEHLLAVAAADGLDVAGVHRRTDQPTGRALIVVDDDAENSIVVVPGANATVDGSGVPSAHVTVAQLEVPVEAVTRAFASARAAGGRTVLNPSPATDLPMSLLAACDVVVPNEHELELLGGVDRLLGAGVGVVVVTRGAQGVVVHHADGRRLEVPAVPVEVVDTTGAGDATCGHLAARIAAGDDVDTAVRWAVAAGALAVTVAGAVPSLPRHDDVARLLGR